MTFFSVSNFLNIRMEDFDIRNANSANQQEKEFEKALRPLTFDDFAGQEKVIENLRIFVAAAKMRGEPSYRRH